MHRIDGEGHNNGEFTEGDPQAGVMATHVTSSWMNSIQRELLAILALAGITPDKLNDSQVATTLVSWFGQLASVNVWSALQKFAAGLSVTGGNLAVTNNATVGGTLGVTGNASVGGTFGATGSALFAASVSANGMINANNGAEALKLLPGTVDHCYIGFHTSSSTPATRHAYLGFAGPSDTYLSLVNEKANGDVRLVPNGTGKVMAYGRVAFPDTVTAPASTAAVKNELTPANMTKVKGIIRVTEGSSPAVTVLRGFNIADATISDNSNGEVTVTFAQAFANNQYTVTLVYDSAESSQAPRYVAVRALANGSMSFRFYTITSGVFTPVTFNPGGGAVVLRAHLTIIGDQ